MACNESSSHDPGELRAMQVTSATASASATTAPQSSASATTVDYNTFLTLLVAELKNQDPTKPMDSAQYISQLASFSNVEQAVKMNAKLDSMISAYALMQAEGFVGRTVTSADGSITGTVASVQVTQDGAVATLKNGQRLLLGAGITVS
jgi:flagellar basal-body rod modification protein FlgD